MTEDNPVAALASKVLRESKVRLLKETLFPAGRLSVWMPGEGFSLLHESIMETDGEIYVVTENVLSFQRFLKDARPNITNPADFKSLFAITAPFDRQILDNEYHPVSCDWREPSYDGGALIFFCNDSYKGNCEKWVINSQYDLTVEIVGRGSVSLRR